MSETWPLTRVPHEVPEIPQELAALSLSAMMLGLGERAPRFDEDPYADVYAHNWTRLLLRRMPVLCTGPAGLLTIGKVTL